MSISLSKEAMEAFAEGFAEESVRQFRAEEKARMEANALDRSVSSVRDTASGYSRAVNSFGFNPKTFLEAMTPEERSFFLSTAPVFISLMAKKPYTDGRNEASKAKCAWYITLHPEYEDLAEKKTASGEPLCRKYLGYDEWDIKTFLRGRSCSFSEEEAVALILYADHPTLQQTFAKACLYALMKENGEEELLSDRAYSLPFI